MFNVYFYGVIQVVAGCILAYPLVAYSTLVYCVHTIFELLYWMLQIFQINTLRRVL